MSSEKNYPRECLEEIFRHLSGEELLKSTVVCPEWNSVIGLRTPFMRKIYLECCPNDGDKLDSIDKTLASSERKYKCLKVEGIYSERFKKFLTEDGRSWAHIISTGRWDFETADLFLDHLKIFQNSVQKLVLNGTILDKNFDKNVEPTNLQLP